jgi:hypothetical protein
MRQVAPSTSGFVGSIRLVEVNSLALNHDGAAPNLIEYRNDIFAEKAKKEHLHAAEEEDRDHYRSDALSAKIKAQKLQDKKCKSIKEAQ